MWVKPPRFVRGEACPQKNIAVLERANRSLGTLADALDSLRIPYLIDSPGLFSSREGAMLLAGLRLVADLVCHVVRGTDSQCSVARSLVNRMATPCCERVSSMACVLDMAVGSRTAEQRCRAVFDAAIGAVGSEGD